MKSPVDGTQYTVGTKVGISATASGLEAVDIYWNNTDFSKGDKIGSFLKPIS